MGASDQGVSLDRYMLVPRVLIFARRGSAYLLIKGSPTKARWANRYNGLGGHVEQGEDPLRAARREFREEAGLEADLRLAGTIVVDTGTNPGVGIFVFTGTCGAGEPRPSSEGSLHWLEPAAIASLPAAEDLPALIGRLERWQPGDPPFSARSFYGPDDRQVIEFLD